MYVEYIATSQRKTQIYYKHINFIEHNIIGFFRLFVIAHLLMFVYIISVFRHIELVELNKHLEPRV